jgi:hypothetical protein
MGAFVLAALLAQAAEVDDAALRRFAALLARPETRARGIDRLSFADPKALRLLGDLDPDLLKAAEENESLRHSYGPPRLFSLDGREEELDDVLSRLERESRLTFQRSSLPRGAKVAVRLRDATLLETLSELGRAASFMMLNVEGTQIYLHPGVPPARPRSFHGPLLIEVERICRRTRVGFDATTVDLWLRLIVWWEPGTRPLEGAVTCALTRAVDDAGRSLLGGPAPAVPRPEVPARTGYAMASIDGLRVPAPDAKSMTVEGAVELRFPARVERATFEKAGVVERPGTRIELKTLTAAEPGGVTAEFKIRFDDPARALEYRPAAADVLFETDDPGRLFTAAVSGVVVKEADVDFVVRVPGLRRLEELKNLQMRVPQGVVAKRVPFRFEGVDLR